MKSLKKAGILFSMLFLLGLGSKVQAAELDDVVEKCNETMKNVMVIEAKGYTCMSAKDPYVKIMELAVDKNTGITYMDVFGMIIWADKKAGVAYMYNGKGYDILPLEKDDSLTDSSIDESELIISPQDKILDFEENDTSYIVTLIKKNTDTAEESTEIYYIDKVSYYINKVETLAELEGQVVKPYIEYTYPDTVIIPEDVKRKADLASDYTFEKSRIAYRSKKVKGKTVLCVTESKKAKNKIKIPDTVTLYGKKYKVYGIDTKAFYNNKKITSVTIGNNVQKIGDKAFYNNKKLSSVTIGKNVTHIGKETFCKSKKLKNVTIKSMKLKKIGSKAFNGNAKTLTVKVPKKKAAKYKTMLRKSKLTSKLVIKKF